MIYSIKRILQTNIGSRGRASIGELIVPGDAQNPADSCSFTPLTRPHAPTHPTKLPTGQQTRPEESFQKLLSEPRSSKRSPNARTSANDAVSAAPQTAGHSSELATPTGRPTGQQTRPEESFQELLSEPRSSKRSPNARTSANDAVPAGTQTAGYSSELATPPYASHADKTITRNTTPPIEATDSERARAFWTSRAVARAPAAVSAGLQAVESPSITKPYVTRTTEQTERSTVSPTTVIHDTKPRTDIFTGKPKRVDKDGACLFSSLGGQHSKKLVREALGDWLKKNPHFPIYTTTLAQYVLGETGETWSVYCARMQNDRTWGGLPELVAASQVWHRVVRVFENIGDGLYLLRAVLGEEGFYTAAIDLVLEEHHYDALTEVHPVKMIQPEKIVEARPPRTTPIETLTLELKALGRLKELETCLRPKTPEQPVERKTPEKPAKPTAERKPPEQPVEPKAERKARKELVERQVLDDLAERKELKELEERKARERHAARQKFAERKGEGKVPDHLAVPKAEPESKDLGARKRPKHRENVRKARVARELQDGLRAYRVHRALEELAACKAREEDVANVELRCREDRRARNTAESQEKRRLCETPRAREARVELRCREDRRARVAKTPKKGRLPETPTERGARGTRAHWWTRRLATPTTPINSTTPTEPAGPLPYLPISPCDTTPMPARHWFNVELEHSRSAMTGALDSMIPTTNAALVLAYGRHYGRIAIARLSALDTSRPPIAANPSLQIFSHSPSTVDRPPPPRRALTNFRNGPP